MRVLVVDNHDSFVHTLVGYLTELGAPTDLVESDALPDTAARTIAAYDGVLVSPGPGSPSDAGASLDVIRAAYRAELPLLGVCLGHQALGEVFGGVVRHAPELIHGQTSLVHHDGDGLFAGIPTPFRATRYHSLAIAAETVPAELRVTARTSDGIVMAVEHRTAPLWGVQFHPEGVLTEGGYRLLGNWLEHVGVTDAAKRGARLTPQRGRVAEP